MQEVKSYREGQGSKVLCKVKLVHKLVDCRLNLRSDQRTSDTHWNYAPMHIWRGAFPLMKEFQILKGRIALKIALKKARG